jgi:hypothetical protein
LKRADIGFAMGLTGSCSCSYSLHGWHLPWKM